MAKSKYDVFISWHNDGNHAGKDIAERLKEFIQDEVFNKSIDVFDSDVDITGPWREELNTALVTSEWGILILTPDALDSAWMSYEYGVLRGREKKVFQFTFLNTKKDASKTPFLVNQFLDLNEIDLSKPEKCKLFTVLGEIYEVISKVDNNRLQSKDVYIKNFNNNIAQFKHDIDVITPKINKLYIRNYAIREQNSKIIKEKDDKIGFLERTFKNLKNRWKEIIGRNQSLEQDLDLQKKRNKVLVSDNIKLTDQIEKQKTTVYSEKLPIPVGNELFYMVFVKGNQNICTFYIGETQVTQGLWSAVMGVDVKPSFFKSDRLKVEDTSNYPVENVSWQVIVNEFLPKLNELTGMVFRLPTAIEWEYAAHAGKNKEQFKYSGDNDFRKVAWCSNNSQGSSHPVKSREMHPNGLGIYDMSGNVWEWCDDCSFLDNNRVLCGGSWNENAYFCRLSNRYYCNSYEERNDVGFRLVLDSQFGQTRE